MFGHILSKLQFGQHFIRNIIGVDAEGIDHGAFKAVPFGRYGVQYGGALRAGVVPFNAEPFVDLKFVVEHPVPAIAALQAVLLQVEVFRIALFFQVVNALHQVAVTFHVVASRGSTVNGAFRFFNCPL